TIFHNNSLLGDCGRPPECVAVRGRKHERCRPANLQRWHSNESVKVHLPLQALRIQATALSGLFPANRVGRFDAMPSLSECASSVKQGFKSGDLTPPARQ